MSDDPNAPEIGKNPQRPLEENDVFETPDTVVNQTGAFEDDVFDADDFEDVDDSAQSVDYDADASYQDVSGEAVEDVYAVAGHDDAAFDNVADDQDFSLDSYDDGLDDDLGDDDVFAEDWGDDLNASDSDNGQSKGKASKKSAAAMSLAGSGGSKKLLTYAGGGVGAVVAIAAVYFGLLGGSLPTPQQQPAQQQAQQQAGQQVEQTAENSDSVNTQMAQQAVSPEPIEDQASTSLFDSLDSLPAPVISEELVRKNKEKNFDPNADIFTLLDEPVEQQASGTGGLPMPAPISTTGSSTSTGGGVMNNGELPAPMPTNTAANNADTAAQPAEDDPWAMFNTQENAPDSASTDTMAAQATPDAPVTVAQEPDTNISLDDFMTAQPADASPDVAPVAMPSDTPPPDFSAPQEEKARIVASTQQEEAQTPPAVQTQINQLSSRMDSLDRKLDDILAAQNGSGGSDLSRIESTLQRLEKRIEDIATSKPAPQASSGSKSSTSASASSAKSTAKSPIRKASAPKSSRSAAPKNVSSNWSLRGASPGEALISKKGSSSSIHTVRIGDSVAGLGTVQFIGIDGGRWVVRTTGGTLSQ